MSVCPNPSYLTAIDLAFGKQLAKTPNSQFFLALLMALARQGHLCLSVKGGLYPKLEGMTAQDERRALAGLEELDPELFNGPLVRRGDAIYLWRNDFFERRLERGLKERLQAKGAELSATMSADLTIEQREAVQKALKTNFFILCGGPGRGKTYTAGQIVRSLKKETPHAKIFCAAPTGKAAARLLASLGALEDVQSTTLHALLRVKEAADYFKEGDLLEADLILIDESSMIDIRLFALLFSSLRAETRLILMGDDDQLPPVEAGSVFSQIAGFVREFHPEHYAHLTLCLRSDRRDILDLADHINTGDVTACMSALDQLDFAPLSSAAIASFAPLFPDRTLHRPDPEEWLKKQARFAILTPLKRGPYGTEGINQAIFRMKCPRASGHAFLPIPILITQNDRKLDLYNGEIGLLLRWIQNPSDPLSERDIAYFSDGRLFPALMLPEYELAYAISVHKSQGSEFDQVALFVPPGSEAFGREVLYTGVTRARHKVIVRGDREVMAQMIARSSHRHSGLFHC